MATVEARALGPRVHFPPAVWMVVTGALLLVGALALGAHVQDLVGPTHVDSVAASQLHTRGVGGITGRQTWNDLVELGGPQAVIVVVGALTIWAARRRDLTGAVVAVVGPVAAIAAVEFVAKPLFERRRPLGPLSYPSAHVAAVAALATIAVLIVYRYAGPRLALLSTPAAAVAAGVVAVGVMVLNRHYLTDSLGGVAFGVGVVLCIAGLGDALRSRLTPASTASRPSDPA